MKENRLSNNNYGVFCIAAQLEQNNRELDVLWDKALKLYDEFRNSINNLYELLNSYNKADFWQVDQNFLRDIIYPIVKNNSFFSKSTSLFVIYIDYYVEYNKSIKLNK